jgi:PAS domain S-box-containing protein
MPAGPSRTKRRVVWCTAAAILALFSITGCLGLRYLDQAERGRAWLQQSRRVLDLVMELRVGMMRTALRSAYYIEELATDDPDDIWRGAEQLQTIIPQLRHLLADDRVQLERLDRTAAALARRADHLATLLARAGPGDMAVARPLLRAMYDVSGGIRATLAELAELERQKLANRQQAFDAQARQTIRLLIAASAIAFVACIAAIALAWNQQRLQRLRITELAEVNGEIVRQNARARRNERRLNAVLENGQDAILLVSTGGDIILANRAAAIELGLSKEELAGLKLSRFLPDLEIKDGRTSSQQAHRNDGTSFPIEISMGSCQLDNGPAFVCIMRDITERQRLQQIKDDFVANVSHELRTPLTSIRGSLGLVVGGAAGELSAKAKTLLDIAHKNCIRLIDLVNDLLDVEKIETNRIEMKLEPTELGPLVEAAVEANQGFARQFSVELTILNRLTQGCAVMAHAGRLQQVLANLISNAIKFSPQDRPVQVLVENDAAEVTVSVRDFGPGIPESFRDQMFTRFAQAESGDARRSGGTGLGLSIVKAIVERHGGEIAFESPLPDGGTRFWFTLPRLPGEPVAGPDMDHRPHVLICEDDALVASLLAASMQRGGWRCTKVSTAEEALAKLNGGRFAAMTVDLGLPAMSGLELIQAVDADERHRAMPIVIVSATPAERVAGIGLKPGRVVGWMQKPVEETELRQVLAEAVSRFGSRRILHVEDDDDLIMVVREIVGGSGEVEVASSMAAARELLEQRRFDLVILDMRLPDGNGLDLIPLLRATNPQAALLILSAEDVSEGGHAMIRASLTKARMDNDQLAQTIGRLLAEARQPLPQGEPECRRTP